MTRAARRFVFTLAFLAGSTMAVSTSSLLRFVPEADAQATVICQVATRVIRTAADACGTQILTDPIGCAKRVWEENRGLIEGIAGAAREGFNWLVEKAQQLGQTFGRLVNDIKSEAGLDPDAGFASNAARLAGAIASRGLDLARGVAATVQRAVSSAVSSLQELVNRATGELSSSSEFRGMTSACGDSGVIGKFRSAVSSCQRATTDECSWTSRPGCVRDCLSKAYDSLTAVPACVAAAGRLASNVPGVVGRAATEGAERLKSAIAAIINNAKSRFDQLKTSVLDRVRREVSELGQRVFRAAAQPIIGQIMSSLFRERPSGGGGGGEQGVISLVAQKLAAMSSRFIEQGLRQAISLVQGIVQGAFGVASFTVDGLCAAATASIAGVGVVLQPVCACVVGALADFALTRLVRAITDSLVRPAIEAAIRQYGEPLANELVRNMGIDNIISRLLDGIQRGGRSAVSSAINALPDWIKTGAPTLLEIARSSADTAVDGFVASARTCASNRASAGFFGTIDCLVAAVRTGLSAGGQDLVSGVFRELFGGEASGLRARYNQLKQRVLSGLEQLGLRLPEEVVRVLETGGQEALLSFGRSAVGCLTRLAGSGSLGAKVGNTLACLGQAVGTAGREGLVAAVRQIIREIIGAADRGAQAMRTKVDDLVSQYGGQLPGIDQLRGVLSAATREGAATFRREADPRCVTAFERLEGASVTAVLNCFRTAAGLAFRGAGAGALREALTQAVGAFGQAIDAAKRGLNGLIGRFRDSVPIVSELQEVVDAAGEAGKATFVAQAGRCPERIQPENIGATARDAIRCVVTAARAAFRSAGVGALREAMRLAIDGFGRVIDAGKRALQGLIERFRESVSVVGELQEVVAAATDAGKERFVREATRCPNLIQERDISSTAATAVRCVVTAGRIAFQTGLTAGIKEALTRALQAFSGVIERAKEGLQGFIGRYNNVPGVNDLSEVVRAAADAGKARFVERSVPRCPNMIRESNITLTLGTALQCVRTAAQEAFRAGATAGVKEGLTRALQSFSGVIARAKEALQGFISRYRAVPGVSDLSEVVGAATEAGQVRFLQSSVPRCPNLIRETDITGTLSTALACVRTAAAEAFRAGATAGVKEALTRALQAFSGVIDRAKEALQGFISRFRSVPGVTDLTEIVSGATEAGKTRFLERSLPRCPSLILQSNITGTLSTALRCVRTAAQEAFRAGATAGVKDGLTRALQAFSGAIDAAKDALRGFIGRFASVPGINDLSEVVTAATEAGKTRFLARALPRCPNMIRENDITGTFGAALRCVRTAGQEAFRAGATAGVKEGLTRALQAFSGAVGAAKDALRSFIGRFASVPGVNDLSEVVNAATEAGKTRFLERSLPRCPNMIRESNITGSLSTALRCVRTAGQEAFRAGATAGLKEGLTRALEAFTGAIGAAKEALRGFIGRFASVPGVNDLAEVVSAATETGKTRFRQRALPRCPSLIRESDISGTLRTALQCVRTAGQEAFRAGATAGVKEGLNRALQAFSGAIDAAKEALRGFIGRFASVPGVNALSEVVTAATEAGKTRFRQRALPRCPNLIRENDITGSLSTALQCVRTAGQEAFRAGTTAGVKEGLTRALQAFSGAIGAAKEALRGFIGRFASVPGVNDLSEVVSVATEAGKTRFRQRALPRCPNMIRENDIAGSLRTALQCVRTAGQEAFRAGTTAGVKEGLTRALQAFSGAIDTAKEALRGFIGRFSSVPGISSLSEVVTAATEAGKTRFRQRTLPRCPNLIRENDISGSLRTALQCVRTAGQEAFRAGTTAGVKEGLTRALQAFSGAIDTAKEALRGFIGRFASVPGVNDLSAVVTAATEAGKTRFRQQVLPRCPNLIRENDIAGSLRTALQCVRTAGQEAFRAGATAGVKEGLTRALQAFSGAIDAAKDALRGFIGRFASVPGVNDLSEVVRAATEAGKTRFRQQALPRCPNMIRENDISGSLRTALQCVRTAGQEAFRAGATTGVKEGLTRALQAFSGAIATAKEALRGFIGRFSSVPGVNDLSEVVSTATEAGKTRFRQRALPRCPNMIRENDIAGSLRTALQCVRTAGQEAFRAGATAGVKEGLTRALQAFSGAIDQAKEGLRGFIGRFASVPGVNDLSAVVTAATEAGKTRFRERTLPRCPNLIRESDITGTLRTALQCVRTASAEAFRAGATAGVKEGLTRALQAFSGAIAQAKEALRGFIGRFASVPGVNDLAAVVTAATEAGKTRFRERTLPRCPNLIRESDITGTLRTALQCVRTASTEAFRAGATAGVKEALTRALQTFSGAIGQAKEALRGFIGRFASVPGVNDLSAVVTAATEAGKTRFRQRALPRCPNLIRESDITGTLRTALQCVRTASTEAFRAGATAGVKEGLTRALQAFSGAIGAAKDALRGFIGRFGSVPGVNDLSAVVTAATEAGKTRFRQQALPRCPNLIREGDVTGTLRAALQCVRTASAEAFRAGATAGVKEALTRALQAFSGAIAQAKDALRGFIGRFANVPGVNDLSAVVTAATEAGKTRFRQGALPRCPNLIRESDITGTLRTALQCVRTASTEAFRAGAAAGVKEALTRALQTFSGAIASAKQALTGFIGRFSALPGVNDLSAVVTAATEAGKARFRQQALPRCPNLIRENDVTGTLRTALQCVRTAGTDAFRAGATAGVKEGLSRALQAFSGGLGSAKQALSGFISRFSSLPGVNDLSAVVNAATEEGKARFRQQALPRCPNMIRENNVTGTLRGALQCTRTAATEAFRAGATAGVKEALNRAIQAFSGAIGAAKQALTGFINRFSSLPGVNRLSEVVGAAIEAGRARFRQGAGRCPNMIRENNVTGTLGGALSCIVTAGRSAFRGAATCTGNKVLRAGSCAECPTGQRPNTGRTACERVQCTGNKVLRAGSCAECPTGQRPNTGRTACERVQCTGNKVLRAGSCAACPTGQRPNTGRTACERVQCTGNKILRAGSCAACPTGQRPNTGRTACERVQCTGNKILRAGSCEACPTGQRPNTGRTACQRSCPVGQELLANGRSCGCTGGKELVQGACRTRCRSNETRNRSGSCVTTRQQPTSPTTGTKKPGSKKPGK